MNPRLFLIEVVVFLMLLRQSDADYELLKLQEIYESLTYITTGYAKLPIESIDTLNKMELQNSITYEVYNLKCYLTYIALSYSRIIKHLLKVDGESQIENTIGHIASLKDHVYKIIIPYSNYGITGIYGLWLLYLFTAKIGNFYTFYKDNNTITKKILVNMSNMNNNINCQLKNNFTDVSCSANQMDIRNAMSNCYIEFNEVRKERTLEHYGKALAVFEKYKTEVKKSLELNQNSKWFITHEEFYVVESLYLNNYIEKNKDLDKFLTLYDPLIEWGDTKSTLEQAYHEIDQNPIIMFDGLKCFQKFMNLTKNLLKIIMLRIMLTHINLFKIEIDNRRAESKNRVSGIRIFFGLQLNKENNIFVRILNQFIEFLNLTDSIFIGIKIYFEKNLWKCIMTDKCVEMVKRHLLSCSMEFSRLSAMNEKVIESPNAFFMLVKELEKFGNDINIPTNYRETPIRKKTCLKINLIRATIFVNHIKHVFSVVNFHYMSWVLDYAVTVKYQEMNIDDM